MDYAVKSERLNIVHQLLRAHALYEKRRQLRRAGRGGADRRRVHGAHDARASVVARDSIRRSRRRKASRSKARRRRWPRSRSRTISACTRSWPGMTGTAETEETEFFEIYKLEVAVIPTNRPIDSRRPARSRLQDAAREVQRDRRGDAPAARAGLSRCSIGTTSVEASETLSKLFQRGGIVHNVLNAKYHQREAEIVAQRRPAGRGHDRDEHGGPRHRHQARRRASAVRSRRR